MDSFLSSPARNNPTGLEIIHAGESVKVKYLSKNVYIKLCIWPTRTQDKCDTNPLWLRVNKLRNKKLVALSYLNSQELNSTSNHSSGCKQTEIQTLLHYCSCTGAWLPVYRVFYRTNHLMKGVDIFQYNRAST